MGKAAGYVKSEIVKEGTVMKDLTKRLWVVGQLLGQGGFGSIYTARESAFTDFKYVIKIEPMSNGPLFTEIKIYKRICREKEIISWMNEKKLKFLGMPRYISDGLEEVDNNRFLIMDRYGSDLHKILMTDNLSHKCLFQIAINILDILEYIHSKECCHADIKALNILQGYESSKKVFLLDFGMVNKFSHDGKHVPEKVDAKIKHNGTLEFCPRDSHRGLQSCRRSDIESLMFNLIFWLTWDKNNIDASERVGFGKLPWMSLIKGHSYSAPELSRAPRSRAPRNGGKLTTIGNKSPSATVLKQVSESKEKHMAKPNLLMESVGLSSYSWSADLLQVLTSVSNLKYSEAPNYDEMRHQFAKIICIIDDKSMTLSKDINKFRDIDWKTPRNTQGRKSDIAIQVSPPSTSAIRKRQSSDTEDLKPNKSGKKQRKAAAKVLVTNNSCDEEIDEIDKKKSTKKTTTRKKKIVESQEEDIGEFPASNPSSEFSDIIPKAAWIKFGDIVKKVIPDNRQAASNSNVIDKENIVKVTKPRKPKVEEAPSVASSDSANNIIPGMKVLQQLKNKASTSIRSSPRLAAKTNQSASTSNAHRSISCQTSPSLSRVWKYQI